MKARLLDVESKYPVFSLWDVVECAKDLNFLRGWIDQVITHGTVCIAESDTFSLDGDGLLLRFAQIKALSRESS